MNRYLSVSCISIIFASTLPVPNASAECSCTAQEVDVCIIGTWAMNASELAQVTDGLMKDLPAKLVWRSGSAMMMLNADATYANSVEDIDAGVGEDGGLNMSMNVTGGASGNFCANSGKLCFTESDNDLSMKMSIPGTGQEIDLPIGDNAKTQPIDVDYTCSTDTLKIDFTIHVPEEDDRIISFPLVRQ